MHLSESYLIVSWQPAASQWRACALHEPHHPFSLRNFVAMVACRSALEVRVLFAPAALLRDCCRFTPLTIPVTLLV
jgi:hypothetical protein